MSPTSCSRRGRAAIAGLLVLAVGCGTLSVSDERKLGEKVERDLRGELQFVRDRVVVDYVDRIGEEIVRASGPQPFRFHFYVVEDEDINAFALPAGYIYIHTGTVLKAANVSELAGVIAHEVGHVAHRHVAENYNKQRAASVGHQILVIGAGILWGRAGAELANLGGGLAAIAVLNTFTREAERDADAFAVGVLPNAGYDPHGLLTFFETLRQEGGPRPPKFLSSHPPTEERIAATTAALRSWKPRPGLRVDDNGRLEIIQSRVRLLTGQELPAP